MVTKDFKKLDHCANNCSLVSCMALEAALAVELVLPALAASAGTAYCVIFHKYPLYMEIELG